MQACPDWLAGLRAELATHPQWAGVPLAPLPDKGLAHHHVRLEGTGLLARIPKQSQLGLPPAANLAHQQACFERAAAGGHAPRLSGALPVSTRLPRGALLVEEIAGGPALLPRALGAIARSLAALHALPLPPVHLRAPIASPADPLRELVEEIVEQARHLPAARLAPEAAALLEQELAALQQLVRRGGRPPLHLIAFDAHPGNFVVRPSGEAVLVDLEKCRYGYAGLDLAHATLYTSTTWDVASHAILGVEQVRGFYQAWGDAVGGAVAAAARPWHVPLRQAMWLWSLTWCCKWRALSRLPPRLPQAGEDWSAVHSEGPLVAHVRERVDHYLSPSAMALVQRELHSLQAVLAR
ncbi:MAG: phosphotransferase [Ramlibacter sp.]